MQVATASSYISLRGCPDASVTTRCLLRPGRDCWWIAHAERLRLLIDAADYFSALRQAMVKTRHSLYILGWDIDSRIVLAPAGCDDGLPAQLGDLMHALTQRQRLGASHHQKIVIIDGGVSETGK